MSGSASESLTGQPEQPQASVLRNPGIDGNRWSLHALRALPGQAAETTLLNCLGVLDEPDSGSVFGGNPELSAMRESDRLTLRQTHLGFVFQSFGLIPFLTATENVEVPMRLVGARSAERQARVNELLELVGLGKQHHQRPTELSGGQHQRVALPGHSPIGRRC